MPRPGRGEEQTRFKTPRAATLWSQYGWQGGIPLVVDISRVKIVMGGEDGSMYDQFIVLISNSYIHSYKTK